MKIFFYKYGSICEPDISDSFRRLGFEVIDEDMEIYNKNLLPSQCVETVSKKLIDGQFTFVFTINFFPWLSDLCEIMHLKYISLIVDSPVLELYSYSLKNDCNRIFLFDRCLYNEFESFNQGHIFHVPLAADVNRIQNVIKNASTSEKAKFASDISFIGSTYQEKCPFNRSELNDADRGFTDGIIEAQLKVYGYNFIEELITEDFATRFLEATPGSYRFPESYRQKNRALVAQQYICVKVAEQERLRALRMLSDNFNVDIYTGSDTSSMPHIHNRGFAKSLTEMPIIFNQSKINLNITAKSIRSGLSLRIFDVLAAGGFLITNYQTELPEFFEIGKDLVAYDSFDSLKELCSYYLAHDNEREEIARHGFETVARLHTYDTRILQMLDMAFPE